VKEGEDEGKYFVRYDEETAVPILSDKVEEAGVFVLDDNRRSDSLYGNLCALYDRFGLFVVPEKILNDPEANN